MATVKLQSSVKVGSVDNKPVMFWAVSVDGVETMSGTEEFAGKKALSANAVGRQALLHGISFLKESKLAGQGNTLRVSGPGSKGLIQA